MSENEKETPWLEVGPEGEKQAEGVTGGVTGTSGRGDEYLETSGETEEAREGRNDGGREGGGRRKKIRAGERQGGAGANDEVSLQLVQALAAGAGVMAALWPDVPNEELLRAPPSGEVFSVRIGFARRAIDAVGRRDAESRVRAEAAQRRLDAELKRLEALGPTGVDAALAELKSSQERAFVEAVRTIAGPERVLWAADGPRVDRLAVERGLDPVRARELLAGAGISLHRSEARAWLGLQSLPGEPSTLDGVGEAMLRFPAQGAEAVRRGAVIEWLRSNGASAELLERGREARLEAERGGADALVVHLQAWSLGRREIVLGGVWFRDPEELLKTMVAGEVSDEILSRAAVEGVLGAWLRSAGRVAAAGASVLIARGEALGVRRLSWALGEPLKIAGKTFGEPSRLVREVLGERELREGLKRAWANGELLAWLESLPPAYRDEHWVAVLRRGGEFVGDEAGLWSGVYGLSGEGVLTVVDARGEEVRLTGITQLRVTAQAAAVWDDLKRAFRTGELAAWLDVVAPERPKLSLRRPSRDEDSELNEVLWSLGHTGLVLEWGNDDLAVRAPTDIVRAYRASWSMLEAQLSRGYPLTWLERFHGGVELLQGGAGGAATTMAEVIAGLRAEVGRLPAGWAGLKLALLCGLRALPIDPCVPGDDATVRGYTGTSASTEGALAWEPLRGHVVQGAAMVWLALDSSTPLVRARALLSSAFGVWNPGVDQAEFTQRMLSGLARAFGAPTPSAVLRAELGRVTGVPTEPVSSVPRSARSGRLVLLIATVLTVGAGAVLWPTVRDKIDRSVVSVVDAAGQGEATGQGEAVWVSVRVTLSAVRSTGSSFDLDGSPPELRAVIEPRDEAVEVGPCPSAWRCTRSIDTIRLVPNVPFRVKIFDDDPLRSELLGTRWLRWSGSSTQRVSTTVRDVTMTLEITRVRVSSSRQSAHESATPRGAITTSDVPTSTGTPGASGTSRANSHRRPTRSTRR